MERSINYLSVLPNETYFNVLQNLLPSDINKCLRVSPDIYNKIRHDRYFWKHKLSYDFGFKSSSEDTYGEYVMMFSNENLENSLYASAGQGHLDLFKYIHTLIQHYDISIYPAEAMFRAIEGNHIHIINHVIGLGFDSWDRAMESSAEVCNKELVQYFISKGANSWHRGLYGALRGNCEELIHFFVEKGAKSSNDNMYYAARAGNVQYVNYFISKGAKKWNRGLAGAARENHRELVDFFIQKGANNWNEALIDASIGGNLDMVKYLVDRGANNFEGGLNVAAQVGYVDLIEYFISMGANNWISAFSHAVFQRNDDVVKMFQLAGNIDIPGYIQNNYEQGDEEAEYIKSLFNITH